MIFQYISCYCLSPPYMLSSRIAFISIHLMLLFITDAIKLVKLGRHFNTSHVTVYPANSLRFSFKLSFQYISCYCLSSLGLTQQQQSWNFNTSHVTVYRSRYIYMNVATEFQYISCYCLSVS